MLTARVQAESAVEDSRTQMAELEAAGVARLDEVNRLVEELRNSAAVCASDYRSAGSRLVEMADHFEFEVEIPALVEGIGMHDDASVDLDEERLEVYEDHGGGRFVLTATGGPAAVGSVDIGP